MRKTASILIVASLVAMVFVGFEPTIAGDPEEPDLIGKYQRLGSDDDLTREHVSWDDGVLNLEGPMFTSKLRVDIGFLEQELGAWGSHQEFSVGDGFVEFDARRASLEALTLGEDPIFTLGSRDRIEFVDRPMWVSAQQEEHGGQITLEMDDGDSSGQQVFISRDWLWERGIQWFNVTHEDGTLLTATEVAGGVMVDVHHFSEVQINPDGLDVKKVVGGLTVSNQGETRWSWQESVLEVDVDYNPGQEYEVLIPADWTDLHIRPHMFKVHTSSGVATTISLDTESPDCNCYRMVAGVQYYPIEFSTSSLSVMIEVIGKHIPAYTVQNGELAPHWEEKRWNETALLLEIDVEEQSSDYEVWVEKAWVESSFPMSQLNVSHEYTVEVASAEDYMVFDCCVVGDLLPPIVFSIDQLLEARAMVGDLVKVWLGDWVFGGGSCPFEVDGSDVHFLDDATLRWIGDISGSTYENEVNVCYWEADNLVWLYWFFAKQNDGGEWLTQATANEDPCPRTDLGRAYCIRLHNLYPAGQAIDDWRFRDHEPDQNEGSINCKDFTLTLKDPDNIVEISWDVEWCDTQVRVQKTTWDEGRWYVAKERDGDAAHRHSFDFGVVQRIPMPSDDQWESDVMADMITRFMCRPGASGSTCIRGIEEWELHASKQGGVQAFNELLGGTTTIGAKTYDYNETIAILNARDNDEATKLATTLIGAQLLIEAGSIPDSEVMVAIIEAHDLLANYTEMLPWENTELSVNDQSLMESLRHQISNGFVNEMHQA